MQKWQSCNRSDQPGVKRIAGTYREHERCTACSSTESLSPPIVSRTRSLSLQPNGASSTYLNEALNRKSIYTTWIASHTLWQLSAQEMSLCIYFFVRLDWSYQRLSKPCHSQEHPAYICRTEGNRTGERTGLIETGMTLVIRREATKPFPSATRWFGPYPQLV